MSQENLPNLPARNRKLIIACEDDAMTAAYIKAVVRAIPGANIKVFDKLGDAMLAIRQDRPGLVIMDHHLKGRTGAEGLLLMRNSPWGADIPVVVYTGADVEAEARKNGANAFIRKPATVDQILDVIKPFLAQS